MWDFGGVVSLSKGVRGKENKIGQREKWTCDAVQKKPQLIS